VKVVHLSSIHAADDPRIFLKECISLKKSGYEVVLIAPHSSNEIVCGISIRAIPMESSLSKRLFCSIWRIFRKALKEKADVYHFHDPELIIIGVLLKLFGKYVIRDIHEDLPLQLLSNPRIPVFLRKVVSIITRIIEYVTTFFLDGIIAATPTIGERFPHNKTSVVQNFPILGEFEPSYAQSIDKRSNTAVYIGDITIIRGINEMLKAFSLIPKQEYQARLLLAGRFDPPELENELEGNPGWRKTFFKGWQDREGIRQVLSEAKVGLVVLHPRPNYLESYPIKLFEYMSAGIPVVASDFPLWRSIIEKANCGLLVNPLDPKAIALAVQWLFDHPERAEKMGLNGRRSISERFNWGCEEQKILKMYNELFLHENTKYNEDS
jgi:glycosyltransferase involved in cell wall biosynthesis